MTSNATCRTADGDNSNALHLAVVEELAPVVNVTASPGSIIGKGATVTFTAVVSGAGAVPSYLWRRNSSAISGATQALFTTSLLDDGDVITCDVTGYTVCGSYTGAGSKVVTVISANGVSPLVSSAGGIGLAPNPNNGTFSVSGINGLPAVITVTDAVGRSVYSRYIGDGEAGPHTVVLGAGLPGGMYILTAGSGNGVSSVKFCVTK